MTSRDGFPKTPNDILMTVPSSRNFATTHPNTLVANLHSDPTRISPVFSKISKTVFAGRAELCGGYGRRMNNTSISADAPTYFVNPERVHAPSNKMDSKTASVIGLRVPAVQEPFAVNYVLPAGDGLKKALTTMVPHNQYRTFKHNKQTYIENLVTDRKESKQPISWDSGSSARSNESIKSTFHGKLTLPRDTSKFDKE